MTAIELHARATPGFAERLAATRAQLREAAERHSGRIVQASSLGAEDMVVTDLVVRDGLGIPVAMLDTGELHAETLALADRAQAHWGVPIEVHRPPQEAVVRFVQRHGPRAMYDSVELRHACCALRKLEPLARMLSGRDAWVTGLRREQSAHRAAVPPSAPDEQGRTKFNPLADWSWADVWHYIAERGVPYNPLHDQFMPSIGCAPCTRAIALGEDFRAGRWWWEQDDHKECGLHAADASPRRSAGSTPAAKETG